MTSNFLTNPPSVCSTTLDESVSRSSMVKGSKHYAWCSTILALHLGVMVGMPIDLGTAHISYVLPKSWTARDISVRFWSLWWYLNFRGSLEQLNNRTMHDHLWDATFSDTSIAAMYHCCPGLCVPWICPQQTCMVHDQQLTNMTDTFTGYHGWTLVSYWMYMDTDTPSAHQQSHLLHGRL